MTYLGKNLEKILEAALEAVLGVSFLQALATCSNNISLKIFLIFLRKKFPALFISNINSLLERNIRLG